MKVMSKNEYRAILDELDWTRLRAAKALGISLRAAVGYANGDFKIPAPTATLLRLWLGVARGEKVSLP